jgi:hypothetical protein
MDYELAKELKEEGFPQPHEGFYEGRFICQVEHEGEEKLAGVEYSYSPTLSELIEACVSMTEDGDFHLEHLSDEWGAATCFTHREKDDWERGKTPEEAVARLWLALNR